MIYKKEGLEAMEYIESSLANLANLAKNEFDPATEKKLIAHHKKTVAEYQALLLALYDLSEGLENSTQLILSQI